MSGVFAVFYRDYRQRITNIGFMFWDVLAPLAYLLLFGTGFERLMAEGFVLDGKTIEYGAFLLPGVLAMTTFSVAMNTSWGFFMDKDSGIFYELLTYPITRGQFLIGKIAFNVLLSAAGCALTIAMGAVMMGVPLRWSYLPLAFGIIILTTAGWFFLFSNFAIRMNRMDAFNTFTSAAYILLMFVSSLFYPIAELPVWIRYPAYINPMTWQADALRFALLGVGEPVTIALEAAGFAAFGALCLAFAARALNRVS